MSPEDTKRMMDALDRVQLMLEPKDGEEITVFDGKQVSMLLELIEALDRDGVHIIEQIIRRERQVVIVRSWFEARRKRMALIGSYVLGFLGFAYAIRDFISDAWRGVFGG